MEIYYVLLYFFVYGFLGWCGEVAFAAIKQRKFVNRGFLNGPICPIYGIGIVSVVAVLEPLMDNSVMLYLGSAVLVTTLEWITGFLLEKLFHHKWWDYSNMPLNLNGYVCVPFSLVWGAACVVIVRYIHPLIYRVLVLPPMWTGKLLLVILLLLLIADLYVTVTEILKLNRRLKKMEEIAAELQNLSEQIGKNISRNVLEGLEKQENTKQKAEDRRNQAEALVEEKKVKLEELKLKYCELLEGQPFASRRLMKAFPKMKPGRYEKQFRDIKKYLMKKAENKKEK